MSALEMGRVLAPPIYQGDRGDSFLLPTQTNFGLRVNSPRGEAKWAIDPWDLRAKCLIVLVSPN